MATVIVAPGRSTLDTYAPNFRVEIEGERLDPETHGDILEVKVVMDIDDMASFDLTINNWDDTRVKLKYSDGHVFDPGRTVHVFMGYADDLVTMISGQITTLSPHYPDSGAATLTVGGLDGMFKLRDRKPPAGEITKYTKKTDAEIAQFIARRNGLDSMVSEIGVRYDEVVQKNQDDATFLMERAKRIDFDCYVAPDPVSGKQTLYFLEPRDGRSSSDMRVFEFEWGRNLVSFNPTINLSRQVGRVTVRGWDHRNKRSIVYTATDKDLPKPAGNKGSSGPKTLETSTDGKEEVVVDAHVASEQEARTLAITLLTERAYEFITGSGQAIGLPQMRPGDNVGMSGLGSRFDGLYYVKRTEHVLNDSGYRTQFEVRSIYDRPPSEERTQ